MNDEEQHQQSEQRRVESALLQLHEEHCHTAPRRRGYG
jgi:hypothetical protein